MVSQSQPTGLQNKQPPRLLPTSAHRVCRVTPTPVFALHGANGGDGSSATAVNCKLSQPYGAVLPSTMVSTAASEDR